MNIPFTQRTLGNGLDVIVHEDHDLPIVAVNLWYHVGSKNERRGRTGFAHLFEHLMFEGSAHHDHGYFAPLQRAGASLNGSTSADRTNYWEVVPNGALDLALWLESDRMGHLLPALTQAKFDNQRDVVLNERRQNYENRPYGLAGIAVADAALRSDHPYSWPTIGYLEDLRAASLDDVHEFFRTYYHPRNASLVLAGDITVDRPGLAERYFGDVARRPRCRPCRRRRRRSRERRRLSRGSRRAAAPLPRVALAALFDAGDAEARPACRRARWRQDQSRLYRALVVEQQIATEVTAVQYSRELCGMFQVVATAAPGVTLIALAGASVHRRRGASDAQPTTNCAQPGAGRGPFRLPPADDRWLLRQVRSAERLQRVPRRSGLRERGPRAVWPCHACSVQQSAPRAVAAHSWRWAWCRSDTNPRSPAPTPSPAVGRMSVAPSTARDSRAAAGAHASRLPRSTNSRWPAAGGGGAT